MPEDLDPVQDCRRPRRNEEFRQRLNFNCLHRRVKTGFRFTSLLAMGSGYGSNLDTPRHQVREGRLFNVVLPGLS